MTNQERYEANKEHIKDFLHEYFNRRKFELQNGFMCHLPIEMEENIYRNIEQSPLAHQLDEINRAACGMMADDDEGWNRGVTYEGVQDLCERLFAPPALSAAYHIPDDFWSTTPFGRMVRDAYFWTAGDELITQARAADLCSKSIQSINNWIREGKLSVYSNEGSNHKPGGKLVSKNEVLKLCE